MVGSRDRRLLAAVLAPPVIWLAHLSVAYALVPSACIRGTSLPLHAATVVALAAIGAAALTSWRVFRGAEEASVARERRHAMSVAGLVFGAGFAILVLTVEIPISILRSCS